MTDKKGNLKKKTPVKPEGYRKILEYFQAKFSPIFSGKIFTYFFRQNFYLLFQAKFHLYFKRDLCWLFCILKTVHWTNLHYAIVK